MACCWCDDEGFRLSVITIAITSNASIIIVVVIIMTIIVIIVSTIVIVRSRQNT